MVFLNMNIEFTYLYIVFYIEVIYNKKESSSSIILEEDSLIYN